MRTQVGALIICLLLLLGGCAQPAPTSVSNRLPTPESPSGTADLAEPTIPPRPKPSQVPHPTVPDTNSPRLLLDLPLGDDPDQPGAVSRWINGITPRGPVAFAAEWHSIFLVDQAKGRILHYENGRLIESIPVPWLDDWQADLSINPLGIVVTTRGAEYTLEGLRLRDIRPLGGGTASAASGKGPTLLGKDNEGNRYEWELEASGPIARRVNQEGTVQAVVNLRDIGDIRHWCLGRDGSLYVLTEQWGQDRVGRIKVYEILPSVTWPSPGGGADPAVPPVFGGRVIPSRIRLRFPDWAPLEVSSEIDRWNLWWLLTTATPASTPPKGEPTWQVTMENTFPDESMLTFDLRDDYLSAEGSQYSVGAAGALRSLIESVRLSEQGLKGALDAAIRVRISVADLPGGERELNRDQRQLLRDSLTGSMAVSRYAPPLSLEPPFPQYAIRLQGASWEGTLLLAGDRHLVSTLGGVAVHSGRTAALVRNWLPMPDLTPDQVGYLYLADRLEIGEGHDLTRWKNSVVRRLIQARSEPQVQSAIQEPFTLTFWVKGEKWTVEVDTGGFTYNGKRYRGSGLTGIARLQEVP